MNPITAFATAFRTLTILPFPGRQAKTENFRQSLAFFPVIGLVLSAVLYGVFNLCLQFNQMPPLLCGLLLVATNIVLTGALHLDGLADVCDGFGGGATREKILEILKDPRQGTFGVTAIVLDVLAKVILYGFFIERHTFTFIALSLVVSRSLQVVALTYMPYAGVSKGMAGAFSGTTGRFLATGSAVLALGLCCMIQAPMGAIACCVAGGAGALFLLLCMKKIGGIRGDCVGALSEIAEIGVLVTGIFC